MRRIPDKLTVRQRGAVLVEMALVTPILLAMMLATAEVTRAFVDHNTLTKAVRNGARYVATNALQGTTGVIAIGGALTVETQNLVVYGNIAGTGAPVLPGLTVADITVTDIGGDNVRVARPIRSAEYSARYCAVSSVAPISAWFTISRRR